MESATAIVYVVDDDPSLCRALKRLLGAAGYPVESYSSATDFIHRSTPDRPGCLLLDVRLPDLPGLEVQRLVSTSGVPMPIIFMTGYADVTTCVQAMKGGAADFLLKPFQEADLLAAVERGIARDRELRRERDELHQLDYLLSLLTPRELEVFRLVAKGMLNKQIAGVLGTKEGTVKMHRGHVMRKLELGSVAELVAVADRLRLSDPHPELHARAGRFPGPAVRRQVADAVGA
jgi:FixJ family two-component response regulator